VIESYSILTGDSVLGATMLAYLLERIGHSDVAIV
jgi:hypothetical protein